MHFHDQSNPDDDGQNPSLSYLWESKVGNVFPPLAFSGQIATTLSLGFDCLLKVIFILLLSYPKKRDR